jgi:hypothetical protein
MHKARVCGVTISICRLEWTIPYRWLPKSGID